MTTDTFHLLAGDLLAALEEQDATEKEAARLKDDPAIAEPLPNAPRATQSHTEPRAAVREPIRATHPRSPRPRDED